MRALRLAFHASKQLPGTILTSRNSAAYARDRHCSLKRNKGHMSAHANMTSKKHMRLRNQFLKEVSFRYNDAWCNDNREATANFLGTVLH